MWIGHGDCDQFRVRVGHVVQDDDHSSFEPLSSQKVEAAIAIEVKGEGRVGHMVAVEHMLIPGGGSKRWTL